MVENEARKYKRESAILMDFANLQKLVVNDFSGKNSKSSFIKKFTQEEVRKFLEAPEKNESRLREISRMLYIKSPQYKRLVDYFAGMATFAYVLEPYKDISKVSPATVKNQYEKVAVMLETMSIKHEMLKVMKVVFREDTFYGYEHETKESYYIQTLNPDYCAISSVEDGVYNLSFDFSYFEADESRLNKYAPEFKEKYMQYKRMKAQNSKLASWIELDSDKTIVIKANEDSDIPIPPFAGVFDSIYDIEGFKELRKDKEQLGNYKVLVQKLPIREDSEDNNDFLIDFDNMMMFHNKASQALPDQVGLITTPMEMDEFSFDNSRVDNDMVARSERDMWSGAGVSQLLFNTDKSSSVGLTKSIQTDEEVVFTILRQIERWINRKIKRSVANCYFKINILDITIFNKQEFFENALQASQFGIPVKTMVGASLGMTPSSIMNMAFLENEVLKMHENFIPLSSAHTLTGEEAQAQADGRPSKKDKDLSEEGIKTRDKNKS